MGHTLLAVARVSRDLLRSYYKPLSRRRPLSKKPKISTMNFSSDRRMGIDDNEGIRSSKHTRHGIEKKYCRSLPFIPELPVLWLPWSRQTTRLSLVRLCKNVLNDMPMMENLIANVCEQAIKLTNWELLLSPIRREMLPVKNLRDHRKKRRRKLYREYSYISNEKWKLAPRTRFRE